MERAICMLYQLQLRLFQVKLYMSANKTSNKAIKIDAKKAARFMATLGIKMNIKNQLITIGSAFILGAGAGWIVKGEFLSVFFTAYVPALVTLLAAYFGAKFAFDFQRNREIEAEKTKNLVNGNLAIFKLISMLNTLLAYQKQIIQPFRNKPTAFLEMSPTLQLTKEDITINIETLSFLLDTDDRNLIGEIAVERERFKSALDAINERSVVHRQEAQPLLAAAGVVQGGNYASEQIEAVLGNRIYVTLHQATDQVVEHVDSTIISIQEICNKLTESLKKQFPSATVLRFSIPKEYQTNT